MSRCVRSGSWDPGTGAWGALTSGAKLGRGSGSHSAWTCTWLPGESVPGKLLGCSGYSLSLPLRLPLSGGGGPERRPGHTLGTWACEVGTSCPLHLEASVEGGTRRRAARGAASRSDSLSAQHRCLHRPLGSSEPCLSGCHGDPTGEEIPKHRACSSPLQELCGWRCYYDPGD